MFTFINSDVTRGMNEDGDPALTLSMSSHAELCYFWPHTGEFNAFTKTLLYPHWHLMVGAIGTTFMDPSPDEVHT